jgi:hypothetical protein
MVDMVALVQYVTRSQFIKLHCGYSSYLAKRKQQ